MYFENALIEVNHLFPRGTPAIRPMRDASKPAKGKVVMDRGAGRPSDNGELEVFLAIKR
jgi:hypothetical protein